MASTRRLFACIWLFCSTVAMAQPELFTEQEREWIARHPTIIVGLDPDWRPLEYIDNDVFSGLVVEYVKAVARVSGLQVSWVPIRDWKVARADFLDGRIDLLPALVKSLESPQLRGKVNYTQQYFSGETLVIGRADISSITSIENLRDKKVAVKKGRAIERSLNGVEVVGVDTLSKALDLVASGEVYAAIDIDSVIMPELRRHYHGVLHVAGTLVDVPSIGRMGVLKSNPLLYSIIEKSLTSLTAEETDRIMDRWLESTDYGAPDLSTLFQFYKWQGLLGAISLLCFMYLTYRASKAQRRAERSEKEKAMFLAVMSHEIRTPMNAILASVELLAHARLPADEQRLAEVAVSSATSLLGLLNDVLDYSKIEAKKLTLCLKPTDLHALIHEAVGMVEVRAQEKALPLRTNLMFEEDIRPVIDVHRLRQILINLLSNAIKFTEKGRVDISAWFNVNEGGKSAMLHLRVEDTGIGMTRNQQSKLFSAFTQADESTTRKYGGTGLGLTICRELVSLMGGGISLSSEPARGTTIEVALPVRLEYASVESSSAVSPLPREVALESLRLNILVVEDHPENQFVIKRQLSSLGHDVYQAYTGQEGLDQLASNVFDIVLLDCNLPDIDGYDVAKHIRKAEQHSSDHLPVIAISAMLRPEHANACFEAGIDGVLTKPLRLRELKEIIELWCDIYSSDASESELVLLDAEQVLDAFLRTSRLDLLYIEIAAHNTDWYQVGQIAHRIRGAALTIYNTSVISACSELEASATAGDPDRVQKGIDVLQRALSS